MASSESLSRVIDSYSDQAPDDKLTLFQILLFSFWIGNGDMHLKNFSLWREPKSQLVRISPGYDFLSTRLLISEKEDPEGRCHEEIPGNRLGKVHLSHNP